MRLLHHNGTLVHLAYNAGVHPAEDLENLIAHLTRYAVPVRKKLGVERLGICLWLAPAVADHLISDRIELVRLRRALDERGLEVVSLNGTGGGKRQESPGPDWAKPERYRYTMALAKILAFLLPEDVQVGSVSTIPIGWCRDWPVELHAIAMRRIERLARELRGLYGVTGKIIRVGFEPAPGCVLETTEQAVESVGGIDSEHLGVCLDVCHLSSGTEERDAALRGIALARTPVVKIGRVHDHGSGIPSTQPVIQETLNAVLSGAVGGPAHVEVEAHEAMTPKAKGPSALVNRLAAELDWTRRNLTAMGLRLAA
ncbi:xylose isomerase [Thermobispora bispora]|jgi:sugar phosphate isomerase/epimerase|uniref:Xylose isomerase domain protein TIM barrel n=1 Tax=Thermobispora bispora (strain ATCC 19993 / DSM 43833 / CBS 139.67 / JCM 10125 / KCTC 9307 / NBRC 14880 / R51) TaxID=469371 RepID=D6Y9S4_THEBD|nr:TIM barrel protein [Thermobispora bispora]ADG90105.1 Xylose isomerase domain protein TIM barrel [Thermobispora bispora DSM 43833]MBO2473154.1 sugar phosphate isomerase/epimerase [Actinomycetales bacterium]MDI9580802.1 TIM barrel protein [Thermobispora sp.]QSI46550.1 sugar phosphate isomerase/epimerase [Thermobispora bispora]